MNGTSGGDRRRAERGGILFKLVLFIAAVAAFALLAWMMFLPFVICREIERRTGFEAQVERLVVNPLNGDVEARGFALRNPAGFPAREFLDVRAFHAEVKLASLFTEQVVVDAVTIEVASITLVKRADGATNVEVFRDQVSGGEGEPGKGAAAPRFIVHTLRLKVDRCAVVDYTGGSPTRREVRVDIDQTFREVTDLKQLLTPEVLRPLAPMTEWLNRLFPSGWGKKLEEAAKSGAEFLKEAGRKTGEAVKELFRALEDRGK